MFSLHNFRCPCAYFMILLAILMLAYSGSSYNHSPQQNHAHDQDVGALLISAISKSSEFEHSHIGRSDKIDIDAGALLHCGADIFAKCELEWKIGKRGNSLYFGGLTKSLRSYFATHDPPPPRFLS